TLTVLVDVPAETAGDGSSDELYELTLRLQDAVEQIESPFTPKWNSTELLILDSNAMNCGRCKGCGCWASDREKAGFLSALNIGAVVNGDLLCDECLPPDHPLAF